METVPRHRDTVSLFLNNSTVIFLPFVMGDIGTFGVVLIGLCFLVSSAEGAKRPPHILYIVADDLGRYNYIARKTFKSESFMNFVKFWIPNIQCTFVMQRSLSFVLLRT